MSKLIKRIRCQWDTRTVVLVCIPVLRINTMIKSNLGTEGFRKPGQECEAKPWRSAAYCLASRGLLGYLSYGIFLCLSMALPTVG